MILVGLRHENIEPIVQIQVRLFTIVAEPIVITQNDLHTHFSIFSTHSSD